MPTTIHITDQGNQVISGNKSFYGDMLLSGENNRIGNVQHFITDSDFAFIKQGDGGLILSAEENVLYDYQQVESVLWGNRTLVDSGNSASLSWNERYLANQNGSPVLYWTGDNIGIGTNNPTEKLQVDGNIRINGVGGLYIYDQANNADNRITWEDSNLRFENQYANDNRTLEFLFNNGPSGETVLSTSKNGDIINSYTRLYIPSGREGYIAVDSEVIHKIGNETISGTKTFENSVILKNLLDVKGDILEASDGYSSLYGVGGVRISASGSVPHQGAAFLNIDRDDSSFTIQSFPNNPIYVNTESAMFNNNIEVEGTGIFNAIDLNNIDNLSLSGVDITITSGVVALTNRPTVNGTGVLLSGEAAQVDLSSTVRTTGNQTISGIKTFVQTGSFNTLQITNKKLSSYSYNSTNFIFGDNYVNLTNSSTNITGTLPSGITSGINYYVKNLNSGILLITGSGQRSIDGFSTVNLYRNESLQLLGVNNVGYTGWVTLSADNGVS
jgi:hypothetical protein